MRLGVIGLELQCALVAVQRFVETRQPAQRVAAIAPCQRIGRIERQCALVAGQRFIAAACVEQGHAEIAVCGSLRAVDVQRPRNQFNRGIEVTLLARDHAQQMQRIELARIEFQHLPVQRLRRFKPSLLVQFDGLLKKGCGQGLSHSGRILSGQLPR